jgi:hypothetical protein
MAGSNSVLRLIGVFRLPALGLVEQLVGRRTHALTPVVHSRHLLANPVTVDTRKLSGEAAPAIDRHQ